MWSRATLKRATGNYLACQLLAFPNFQIHIQSSKKHLCFVDEFTWSNIKIFKLPYFIHETCQQSELLWILRKLNNFCDLMNKIIPRRWRSGKKPFQDRRLILPPSQFGQVAAKIPRSRFWHAPKPFNALSTQTSLFHVLCATWVSNTKWNDRHFEVQPLTRYILFLSVNSKN